MSVLPNQQSLSRPYKLVLVATAASMAIPKRNATNSVLTAEIDGVTLFDNTGIATGVAGNPLIVNTGGGPSPAPYAPTPLGYQQIAATAAAVTLTIPTGATFADISVEGNDARWRDDGVAPTATVGMPLYVGVERQFSGDLAALKLIAQTGTASYNISYYK